MRQCGSLRFGECDYASTRNAMCQQAREFGLSQQAVTTQNETKRCQCGSQKDLAYHPNTLGLKYPTERMAATTTTTGSCCAPNVGGDHAYGGSVTAAVVLTDAPFHILPAVMAENVVMIEQRRWFHAHPELSFAEFKTAERIAHILSTIPGVTDITTGVGRTGVVALIKGGAGVGKCVALRADMDALPLPETAEVPYKSTNAGVMHACGHDGRCASLLGAARVLAGMADKLRGTVKLVFQPAEEGYGGAREMISDGVLSGVSDAGVARPELGPEVDEIFGIHLWSYVPLGKVCVKDGPFMAASDKFEIDVHGCGGHGAQPQGTVDAIVSAASLVTSLQTIVSRNRDPLDAAVLTCGSISGGHGYNIICDKVTLTGTTRTFTPETKTLVERRMREMCNGVAATFGGSVDLRYHDGYPATVNTNAACVQQVRDAARKIVSAENINETTMTCGAEDFSYFLLRKPGAFFFVGAGLAGEVRPHHKSVFDFDEAALLVSASMYVQLVVDALAV